MLKSLISGVAFCAALLGTTIVIMKVISRREEQAFARALRNDLRGL